MHALSLSAPGLHHRRPRWATSSRFHDVRARAVDVKKSTFLPDDFKDKEALALAAGYVDFYGNYSTERRYPRIQEKFWEAATEGIQTKEGWYTFMSFTWFVGLTLFATVGQNYFHVGVAPITIENATLNPKKMFGSPIGAAKKKNVVLDELNRRRGLLSDVFETLDTNKDGYMDKNEFEKFKNAFGNETPFAIGAPQPNIDYFDGNYYRFPFATKDGKVDVNEFNQFLVKFSPRDNGQYDIKNAEKAFNAKLNGLRSRLGLSSIQFELPAAEGDDKKGGDAKKADAGAAKKADKKKSDEKFVDA